MKKLMIALLSVSLLGSAAQAAGVSRILRTTVNETLLQGFSATPPAGWQRVFIYSVVSPATDPAQKIAVVSGHTSTSNSGLLPTPSGLTLISLPSGALLSKEDLPPLMQFSAAECAPPITCLSVSPSVRADNAIPGRLIVTTFKSLLNQSTFSSTYKSITYALDPAAPIGNADRWTPIESTTFNPLLFTSSLNNVSGGSSIAAKLYQFVRVNGTTMRIIEILNK